MPKAASPVRLQAELMQAATIAGHLQHRSSAEQIEYWAAIGRSLSKIIGQDTLLELSAGLVRLRIEPVEPVAIVPEEVLSDLERDRKNGTLADSVTTSSVRYQVSTRHPGQLEQILPDGRVLIGQFHDGVFTPLPEQVA
ncbi:MAG: hypothetical protein OXE42_18325 [Gammaproteobacteria bacterium]|nr:hypothetical protein [Gammaproteobacteria bacterium]